MLSKIASKRLIGLSLFLIISLILLYFLSPYLHLNTIKTYYFILQRYKEQHLLLSILLMTSLYIIVVYFSVPGTAILTISTSFIFGFRLGLMITLISATIGATCLFLFAKWFGAPWFITETNNWATRLQKGFKRNAFSYLLFLRLIPLFPFPLINIIPGLLQIRTKIFITATFIGIIPGSIVYTSLGNGLNIILSNHQTPNLNIIFTPHILLPLIGLALLSLLPIIYRCYKDKKHA